MFSPPVTNCDSPLCVAMKPSRLCPRWPTVIGRATVAEQIGRYKSISGCRASSVDNVASQPVSGRQMSTASPAPIDTRRSKYEIEELIGNITGVQGIDNQLLL